MKFYDLIRACEQCKTQAETKRLLEEHKDDICIRELFRHMLCPSIVFNIKKPPEDYLVYNEQFTSDSGFLWCIRELVNQDLRGKALADAVGGIMGRSSLGYRMVLRWILDRKNPAKIGVSMVNSVWPGLIRTQRYMGAVPGTEEALQRLPWATGVAVQKKEDGMAILIDYKNGVPVSIHTRQGQDITKYFPRFLDSCNRVYVDGTTGFNGMVHHELYVYDTEEKKLLDRKTGNGLINKQVKNGKVGGSVDNCLRSVVLDMVDDDDLGCTQEIRYHNLRYFENDITSRVQQVAEFSLEDARTIAQMYIAAGGEGVICKDPSKPFKNGKPWYNVKIKHEFTVDLRIIDTKEHSANPDLIGSVLCETADSLLQVWVNLRCDSDREYEPEFYIGEIVQVKAESIIHAKTNKPASLYLPRMDGGSWDEYHRSDKPWADSYNEVKQKEKESKGV